jgi:hypothetical protein
MFDFLRLQIIDDTNTSLIVFRASRRPSWSSGASEASLGQTPVNVLMEGLTGARALQKQRLYEEHELILGRAK